MKKSAKQFDAFSRHEVYDRAFAVQHLWELVEDHPVVVADKTLAAEAARVGEAIAAFYQKAARVLMPPEQVTRESKEYATIKAALEDADDLRILDEAKRRGAGKPRIPHQQILEEFGLPHLARDVKKSKTSRRPARRPTKPQKFS